MAKICDVDARPAVFSWNVGYESPSDPGHYAPGGRRGVMSDLCQECKDAMYKDGLPGLLERHKEFIHDGIGDD